MGSSHPGLVGGLPAAYVRALARKCHPAVVSETSAPFALEKTVGPAASLRQN